MRSGKRLGKVLKDSLYTPQVREYIVTRPWPKGLQLDITEDVNDFGLHELYIVFYRDNWLTLSPEKHLIASELVKEVLTKLRADGVPISFGRMESRYGGTGLA